MRALLAALLLIVAAAAPLGAAEPVTVRSGLHDGYGRIVFDWSREVGYRARIDDGRLVVEFEETATFSGAVLQRGLEGYAAAPQVAEEGRRFVMPLTGKVGLKHFRIGPKVVIDLQRRAEAPGAQTSDAGAPAEALPQVRVRGGRHDGFSRLVFDWEAPVGEVLEEAPGRARLLFDRPADFDVSRVDVARLPQIEGLSASREGISLDVPRGSRLKVERAGTKVVLDVLAPPAATPAVEAPATAPVEDLSPRQQAAPSPEPAVAGKAAEEPAAPEAAPTPLVPEAMGGGPPEEADVAAPAAAQAAESPPAEAAAARRSAAAPAAEKAPEGPVAESARGRLSIVSEPLPDFLTSRAQGPKADPFTPVTLTFAWDLPTAAAAFRRGAHLWLVFDRPAPRGVVQQIAAEAPHLGDVQLLEEGGATVLLIRALPTVAPRLSRDGSRWTVDIRPRGPMPLRALAAPVVESEEGGRVRYPVVGAGRMLWLTDPDAGDRLVVVPIRGAGMGLALPYAFPQFRSLQTQQGVVLQPLTSAVEVATVSSGVLVRDRNGLVASRAEQRRSVQPGATAAEFGPGLLKLEEWRRGGLDQYQENRQALQRAATAEAGDRLGIARLSLARFHFAHGLDGEALGVLQVIEAENPRLAQDPEVLLMKGASQLMMQDYGAAAASLAHPALAGEREALLWQSYLAAQAEDWDAAATGFAATLDLIDSYVRHVQLPLGLAAAEAFIEAGDREAATLLLGHLQRGALDARDMAQVEVVQGKLQLALGDPEQARRLWSAARDSGHRPSQARARLALIELGMEEGELSPDAAIEELERLRFAWRGDLFEFTLLRKLADLYVERNRHRDALFALRDAVTNFPDSPVARASAQRMREIFAGIYEGPGDPAVPPLRALALYQEFMELTPAGPDGDRIIAGLADRLVEVDLLDRAAELLEGQVRYRLEGTEKARIGARLALVELLNRDPDASLEALEVSKVDGIEGRLAEQRRHLQARALAALDRPDEALATLEGDDSLDAERLRADVHWSRRAWPEAAEALSNLIPLLPPRRPLQEAESGLVVKLATALLMAGDKAALADLDRRYGSAMAASAQADTFRLLASDGSTSRVASIAEELDKVDLVQDFMAGYRDRLGRGDLSELN